MSKANDKIRAALERIEQDELDMKGARPQELPIPAGPLRAPSIVNVAKHNLFELVEKNHEELTRRVELDRPGSRNHLSLTQTQCAEIADKTILQEFDKAATGVGVARCLVSTGTFTLSMYLLGTAILGASVNAPLLLLALLGIKASSRYYAKAKEKYTTATIAHAYLRIGNKEKAEQLDGDKTVFHIAQSRVAKMIRSKKPLALRT